MCRLFGFRSIFQSKVHSSLIHAENALTSQSVKHSDGWGVGYYRETIPHIIKSTQRAVDDHIFQKISGVVTSKTVIAHLRLATQGKLNILNAHPFQYGKWVFAHNGNLKNFQQYKNELLNLIDPELKPFILGTTDSEIIFFIFLSYIKKDCGGFNDHEVSYEKLQQAIEDAINHICVYSGPLYGLDDQDPKENHITFLLTNGEYMMALNGGQTLYYSTYKGQCPESSQCAFYNRTCESASPHKTKINHLVFASEKLIGENIWSKINRGDLIGVDQNMILRKSTLNIPFK